MAVPASGNIGLLHFTLVLDGSPQIMGDAFCLHGNFVQMPLPRIPSSRHISAPHSDPSGEHRTEPVPPVPHGFVAQIDASLVGQILDVPQRQRKPDIHHHRQADRLGRRVKNSEMGSSCDENIG